MKNEHMLFSYSSVIAINNTTIKKEKEKVLRIYYGAYCWLPINDTFIFLNVGHVSVTLLVMVKNEFIQIKKNEFIQIKKKKKRMNLYFFF